MAVGDNTAGIVNESALAVSINNLLNIPVTDRILYSNGTNIVSSSNFAWNGSSLAITGTGVFSGTVSGANASSAGHFTTLSQLQSAVSGTANKMARFTGTNVVANANVEDDGNKIKFLNKPLQNEISTTLNTYTDVASYDNNAASVTGALVFELPAVGANNQMLTSEFYGYTYSGGSAWKLLMGGYAYNSTSWNNYYSEVEGNPPFTQVSFAWNAGTSKYVMILGTVSTVWAYPKVVLEKLISGYNTSNQLGSGWTVTLVTSLAAYSGIVSQICNVTAKVGGTNVWTGTNTFSNNTGIIGGFGTTSTGGTLDWNDASNSKSGNGYSLLLGTATNGMGGGTYYHPFNFEYTTKDGTGNITQMAIPYTAGDLYYRSRQTGTWAGWRQILSKTTGDATYGQLASTNTWSGSNNVFTYDVAVGSLVVNTTNKYITVNTGGLDIPRFTTPSVGSKVIYRPAITASSTDYAVGVETGFLWNNVPTTTEGFKWYGGTTLAATLTGTGNLTTVGSITGATLTPLNATTTTANTQVYSVGAGNILQKQDTKALPIAPQLTTLTAPNNTIGNFTIDFESQVMAVKEVRVTLGVVSVYSSTISASNMKNGAEYKVFWNPDVVHDVTYNSTYFKKVDGTALTTQSGYHIATFTVINNIAYLTGSIGVTNW